MPEDLKGLPPLPGVAEGALMRSLGRLVRGLSTLFWGLPITLIVAFHSAKTESLRTLGVLPAVICMAWLFYGLWQLGDFQKQERVWRNALDRARILSLIMLGLSPFLYWHNRIPDNVFFLSMLAALCVCALLFLASLNLAIRRLGAMLPDEALRTETRQFTAVNLNLLLAMVLITALFAGFSYLRDVPALIAPVVAVADRFGLALLVPLLLLPLAMTMAMLWKIKEVILDGVFGGKT